MADSLKVHPIGRARNSGFASVDPIYSLSASVVAGLEMFGLAASGMCFAALTQCEPRVLTAASAAADETEEMGKLFLAARNRPPVNPDRMPRCQH
jgi:hypothetical protein